MVPSNVLQRTFFIQYGTGSGTAFTLDIEGKQYLITAKHVVEGIAASDSIQIFYSGNWTAFSCIRVGNSSDADIAVLALAEQISPTHPLPADDTNYFLGQDAYFLGFPYGLRAEVGTANNNFPIPFVKKGIISSFSVGSIGTKYIYLDGHNNPGFSGGPVVYSSPNQQDFKVAAVVSGFRFEHEPIYVGNQQTALAYRYNTGIIVSHGIRHAVDLIRANPVGFELPSS